MPQKLAARRNSEDFRLRTLGPCDQLTAAVRTYVIHAAGAAGTERAFVAADPGVRIGSQLGSALLA